MRRCAQRNNSSTFFVDQCKNGFSVGFNTTLLPPECQINTENAFQLDHNLCNYPHYFYYSVIAGNYSTVVTP